MTAAIGVLLTGCTWTGPTAAPDTPAATATYESTPCFTLPGLPEFQLPSDVSCGFLTVPENRADPHGHTIKVAVARLDAVNSDPDRDPMVYLNGGPGSTSILLAESLRDMGINNDRDVIFVAQRGTVLSEPFLSCPEYDEFVGATTGMSMLSPESARLSEDAVRACHDRLAADGYDLGAYNTTENAADIADLRVALGIDSWHVYGVSYGTLLALQLIRNDPEGISSVVLDSLVPPQDNLLTHIWQSAAGGFEAVFDACAAQSGCAGAYPDLENEFNATVTRLAEEPMIVDMPATEDRPAQRVVLDGYKLANVVVLASSQSSYYAALPKLIHEAATGDGRAAAEVVLNNVPTITLMGIGLRYGVVCRENAPFTTPDEIAAEAKKALPGFPAAVLAIEPQFGLIMDDCPSWDVPAGDPAMNEPVTSDLPVLLMGGTFDAITQPFLADSAAETLSDSRVVRFPAISHDVYAQSECGRAIVAEFLVRPHDYETSCVDAMEIPQFIH